MAIIEYTVDDIPLKTDGEFLTPLAILTRAGLDPKKFRLVLIDGDGRGRTSYAGTDIERIPVRANMKFISEAHSQGP